MRSSSSAITRLKGRSVQLALYITFELSCKMLLQSLVSLLCISFTAMYGNITTVPCPVAGGHQFGSAESEPADGQCRPTRRFPACRTPACPAAPAGPFPGEASLGNQPPPCLSECQSCCGCLGSDRIYELNRITRGQVLHQVHKPDKSGCLLSQGIVPRTWDRGNNDEFLARAIKYAQRRKWSSLLKAFHIAIGKVPLLFPCILGSCHGNSFNILAARCLGE